MRVMIFDTSSRSPPRARTAKVAVVESETRDCIVRSALGLFAKHGIDGVSLRQIVTAAGQSNPSAVHYHFHSKEGLINAVVTRVNDQLRPLQMQALSALAAGEKHQTQTVRDIVKLSAMPFITLYASSADGRMAIRFLSRLTWQQSRTGQNLLFDQAALYMADIVKFLKPLLPHKTHDVLMFQCIMAGSHLLHGLAEISLLGRYPGFGMTEIYRERSLDMVEWFCDYVTGGLSAVAEQPSSVASAA